MSAFFIDRPVFAWVIGLILMLVGGVEIFQLPIAQYPTIAPPQIAVTVTYPGASAQTVADTVVRPIEQQMNGLDGLEYIASTAQASGSMEIDLTFKQGTDVNIAQVQVQNKLSLAEATLPAEVTQQGIRVTKATKNFMMVVGFISTDGSMNNQDISDYIASNIQDPLTRVTGVGDFTLFGSEYAMRIWMDPGKLYKYALTVGDVVAAITAQNIQVSSGEVGGLPSTPGQRLDATIIGPTRYETKEEFENLLLKVSTNGSQVLLKDVARVELGAQTYSITSAYNNQPAAGIALKLAPGANQLSTENSVRAELKTLQAFFPPGLQVVYPLDTEPFITLSITEVVKTLIEAIVLVFVVMYIFLQNFRATLIPTIAVPIVLLGTFGVLAVLGYSINTLTMLAMVLAVGLLVDDAIVVVENVERVMAEEKLSPRDATRKSMEQISGALVGIALVLSAVFLPMAFLGGSTGVIYRQFSVTIVSAMVLSVLVALILTPALCATLLKPSHGAAKRGPFRWFNRGFDGLNRGYVGGVGRMIGGSIWSMLAFVLIVAAMGYMFTRIPSGFLPDEDQALLFGQVALPAGSTAEQTAEVNKDVVDYLLKTEKDNVVSAFSVVGFNFGGQGQNAGFLAISLKDWSVRPLASQSGAAIAGRLMAHFAGSRAAMIFAFQPPAVMELGNASGFDMELVDRANLGHAKLLAARNQLLGMAAQDHRVAAVRPNGLEDAPQYQLVIDNNKANALGVANADINTLIQGALGSTYVNQFMREGRVKQVYVQGEANARMLPDDIGKWYLRNSSGTLVPFSAIASGKWLVGPQKVEGYNGETSFEIQGSPGPGGSTGTAMTAMQDIASKLPAGVGIEWTGLSYEQQQAGSQTTALYSISAIVILFCLAALYESWPIPFAVVMVAPLGVLGAVLATWGRGLDNDVYFQVGLLTTVGLAVKNAILIVEFAKEFFDEGASLRDAALQAARERLRPILMTSLAFVCGVFPLAIASGAGAASRIAIGTAVVGGMVTATLLAVFFVPVFFVTVLGVFRVKPRPKHAAAPDQPAIEAKA
ncbi:efflux RND transporter permease subunit [Acidisphaera sp. L21]|uniref:efflux RND transporter permease subunit n=1 Tax=Acidisphaera sp. L21 TaxID=1641851 RepID=UPI00131CD9BF|nr:efflux RND transporter permease subunit [Acidisphaera sp. L21]